MTSPFDKRTPKPTTARGRLHRALMEGAPDLMQDADFALMKLKRQRQQAAPRKPPSQDERKHVQRPLVTYLRRHLPAGSVVFAVTNHARSKAQVFALLRDGMLAGMPDIGVITATKPGDASVRLLAFIECKHPTGGTLSDTQRHTQAALVALGVPVLSECRSVEQAVTWLREQGVLI